MKLPKRVPQHISETASFKLFSSKIPDNWIIRDVTERDYGIDCYLELVNDQNELTGELALIQLKSRKEITWNKDNFYMISGINISTSNYWMKFPVPVFIFVTDIKNQQVYFCSVGYEIKRNFKEYAKQNSFNYQLKKSYLFEGKEGVFHFKFDFYYEYLRERFETDLVYFLSNYSNNQEFIVTHWGLDFHQGVENDEILILESIYSNYRFLCSYCNVDWGIPTIKEIKQQSKERFGDKFHYELYEYDVAELVKKLDSKTKALIIAIKQFLNGEMDYWLYTNPTVYNFVRSLDENKTY